MWCIVVTTPFTRKAIHRGELLDERWIVDDPAALTGVVQEMLAERENRGPLLLEGERFNV